MSFLLENGGWVVERMAEHVPAIRELPATVEVFHDKPTIIFQAGNGLRVHVREAEDQPESWYLELFDEKGLSAPIENVTVCVPCDLYDYVESAAGVIGQVIEASSRENAVEAFMDNAF